jgi:hypothetical protein
VVDPNICGQFCTFGKCGFSSLGLNEDLRTPMASPLAARTFLMVKFLMMTLVLLLTRLHAHVLVKNIFV